MVPPEQQHDAAEKDTPPGDRESNSPSSENRGTLSRRLRWSLLILCLILAAAIRGLLFVEYRTSPDYAHPIHDAEFRDYWGRALVSGDWTPPPGKGYPFANWLPYPHAPGYAWFLAAVYQLFGPGYDAPRLIQMLLGLVSILLLYDSARRLFNETTGLIAAALMTVYFVFPLYEMDLGPVTIIVFLLLLLISLSGAIWRHPRTIIMLASAFAAGLLAIMRNEFMPFSLLFLGINAYAFGRKKHWLPTVGAVSLWLLCFVIPLIPTALHNYKNAGVIPIFGSEGTCLFYYSNNEWATGYNPDSPDLRSYIPDDNWSLFSFPAMYEAFAKANHIKEHSYHDFVGFLKKRNHDILTRQTGRVLKLMAKKQALFWGPVEIDENKVVACEKEHYAALRWLPGFTPALAAFLLGTVLVLIRVLNKDSQFSTEKRIAWLLLLFAMVAYSAVFMIFYVTARYRVPVIPFMLIFAAGGASHWLQWLRQKACKKAALALIAFILLALLLSKPLVPFTPDTERWLDERRRLWVETERIDEGIVDLEVWSSRHPLSAGGRYHLALLFIEKEAFEEALNSLDESIALDPEYSAAYYNRGIVLLALNRAAEAAGAFQLRLEKAPDDEKAFYALSRARQLLGEETARQEALDRALALKENYPEALVDRSTLYRREGKREHARALLEKALEVAPEYALAEFNLGLLFAEEGSYQKALSFFESALMHRPGRADFHYNTGLVLIQLQRYDEAVQHFQDALTLQPDYPEVYSNLGLSLARLQQAEEAEKAFDQAFKCLPDQGDTLYNYGCALASLGDHEEARRYFKRVLEQEPDHGKALFELAVLDLAADELDNTLHYLNRAGEILTSDSEIRYNLALIRQKQHQPDEAERYFRETLELNPAHFGANRSLGTLLRGAGDSFHALPYLQTALDALQEQEDSALYYEYGVALKDLQRYDEAEEALATAASLAPDSADIRTHQALNAVAQKRYDDAVAYFQQALALDPENDLLAYRLGQAQLESGDAASAVETLVPLLEAMPDHAVLRYDYGRALAALSRHDDAIHAYSQAWLTDNSYLNAITALGFSLSLSGRPSEALEWLEIALQLNPEDEDALFNTGHALHLLGRLEEADLAFQALLRRNPRHSRAWLNRGLILERQGVDKEAQEAFLAALDEEEYLALAHHHLAGLLRKAGQRDEALRHYRRALELDPDNVNTPINLGFALVELGRVAEAEELFTEAQTQAPRNPEPLIGLGDVRMARNALAEAEEAYQEALQLAPDNAVAHKQYGFLLLRQGKSAEALEHFNKALIDLPEDAGLYCGLGDVSFAQGHLDQATASYQKALSLYPDFALAWNNYGDLLSRRGDTAAAVDAYEKARALEPGNISVLLNLGRLHAREKEVDKAVEVLEAALRIESDNLRVRALLGDMKLLAGDVDAAIREYQRILLERPDWQDIRDKLNAAQHSIATTK